MTPQDVLKLVEEKEVRFVDFRFTDTRGKEQHVGVPISAFIFPCTESYLSWYPKYLASVEMSTTATTSILSLPRSP